MASNQAPVVDRIRIIPRPDDFLDRNVGSSGEVFFDKQSKSLRLYDGSVRGGATVLTNNNISDLVKESGVATVTYTVTVTGPQGGDTGNKYVLNGVYKPVLTMVVGYTYVFDQTDQTNIYYPNPEGGTINTHPLNFSSDSLNGERDGGTTYTENVVYLLNDDPVTKERYESNFVGATSRKVQITITSDTPSTLYYWCTNHNAMGNTITVAEPGAGGGSGASVDVSDTAPSDPSSGSIWYKSDTGILYVYVEDGDSNQWVQPAIPVPNILAFKMFQIKDSDSAHIMADVSDDTFTFEEGDGIQLIMDAAENTLTISATGAGGGGDLSGLSVLTQAASGSGSLTYDGNGQFVYTPPDISNLAEVDTLDSITDRGAITTNDITVGDITADSISADSITNTGVGQPEVTSASTLTLTGPDGVIVTGGASGGVFRLPTMTDTQRDSVTAVNGDMIYNSTDNRVQVYQNGAWVRLDTSGIV